MEQQNGSVVLVYVQTSSLELGYNFSLVLVLITKSKKS